MKLRELTCDDYDSITDIWTRSGLPFRPQGRDSEQHVRKEIEQGTALLLGAELDGDLVGVVLGTHDGRKGWINRLAVLPEARKQGIGKALAIEVERRLNEQGIPIVTCLIEGGNDASHDFFKALGYIGHPDITYYAKRQSADW